MSNIKDNLKTLCIERGTTFSQLEKELGFGNGSLAKSDGISARRLYQIAQHFGVSMKSIIDSTETDKRKEKALLERQNKALIEIIKKQFEIVKCYEAIDKSRDRLDTLKAELEKEIEYGR